MLADYHIHLERGPYTRDWLAEFIAAGWERGVREFGITEHGHRFTAGLAVLDNAWVRSHELLDLKEYCDFIIAAKEDGLPVKLGLEMDYVPGREDAIREVLGRFPFDFVIGSIHWLDGWGFDFVGHEECLAEWRRRDTYEVFATYFKLLAQAARTGLFDILGHPDIIKIMGFYPERDWFGLAEEALRAVARAGVCLEVSTAGLRKPVGEIYPSARFLSLCRSEGIPVTLSSDAHVPGDTGRDFDRSVALLTECGYQEFQVFTARERRAVPLPR